MPGAVAEHRLFVEGVDRDLVEVVAAGAVELGEVLLRIARELDVGAGELVPGAPADGDHGDDREQGRGQARCLSAPSGCARSPPPGPLSPPSRRSSQRSAGEEEQREGDAGEQDQQHGDALVDRRLGRRGCRRGCRAPARRAPPAARRARRSPASRAARAGPGRGRSGSRRRPRRRAGHRASR